METNVLWTEFKTHPSDDLKKKIILNYTNLVHYVIHHSKFVSMNIFDDRDYFQFGIEGLHEAIERFDPEFGTKFETYAIQRIRGKIIDEIRKVQIKPRVDKDGDPLYQYTNVSLNQSVNQEEGSMLYEMIPAEVETPLEETEKSEIRTALVEAIKKLHDRDRLVITLYYYEHLSYKEISETLNISVSRVSQIHNRVISQLKLFLEGIND